MTDVPSTAGKPSPGNGLAGSAPVAGPAVAGPAVAGPAVAGPAVAGPAVAPASGEAIREESPAGRITRWSFFGTDRRKPVAKRDEALHFIETAVLRSSLIVAGVAVGTVVGALVLWRLRVVLLLLAVSLFLAALLHPAVSYFDRRGLRRGASTTVVFLGAIAVASGVAFTLFHPVYESATKFARELPSLVSQAQNGRGQIGHIVKRLHLLNYVKQHSPQLSSAITKLGKPAVALGKTVVGGAVAVTTIAVLTFFILLEVPRMFRGVLKWMRPDRAARLRGMAEQVSKAVGGYMLGNLATSVIAGLVVYVALRLTDVPFALVLAIWVALVDFLPLVGGLLAGVPTVALAFLHSVPSGVITLIVFLVYQQVENHVLNPLIMSRTVRLNPLWVLLAILFGAEIGALIGSDLGALLGALLAVPTASAIQVIARDLWVNRHSRAAVPADWPVTPAYQQGIRAGDTRAGDTRAEDTANPEAADGARAVVNPGDAGNPGHRGEPEEILAAERAE